VPSDAVTGDVWEVMSTCRAIRRFKSDPVPAEVLNRCLEAATWAASGGNQQPWKFLVISSPEARAAMAVGAQKALESIEVVYKMTRPAADDTSPRARNNRAVYALHDRGRDVPAAVLFCVRDLPSTPEILAGGSVYPSMQNFMLAARAQGLGAVATGWQTAGEPELRAACRIPDEYHLMGLVIVGWPEGHFGSLRRKPIEQAVVVDRWDQPLVRTEG
jgi:nitroreductase